MTSPDTKGKAVIAIGDDDDQGPRSTPPISDAFLDCPDGAGSSSQEPIDLEDEEEILCLSDHLTEEEFRRFINGSQTPARESSPLGPRRNEAPTSPVVEAENCHFAGMTIVPGKTVELGDEDFLRVTAILKNLASDEVWLRGWRLRRTRSMNGMLNKNRNEVCMMLLVDEDDPRDPLVQGAENISLAEVTRIRRLVITNQEFPARSFRETEKAGRMTTDDIVFNECQLVCRWMYITCFRTAKDREKLIHTEKLLARLRQDDKGVHSLVSDEELRHHWRGETARGGSVLLNKAKKEVIDLTDPRSNAGSRKRSRGDISRRTNTIDLDSEPDSQIDLSLESDAPTTPCPSPSIGAKRKLKIRPSMQKTMSSRHRVSIDITVEKSPKVSVDLTTTGEGQERTPTQLASAKSAHRFEASFETESESARSRTRCNGTISVTQTPAKKQRRESAQYPTPPDSTTSPRIEVTGSRGGVPNRRGVPLTPSSSRSTSTMRSFNVGPIPFRLSRAQTRQQIDLTTDPAQSRSYSFGDGFCGAGGMSCSARSAGLHVAWAFDHDPAALYAYGLNHNETHRHLIEVDQVVSLDEDWRVDLMHLSPPCQFFSPAHTMTGKDDDMNTAAQFAVPELIKKCRPRIVTLEQTFGLLQRHRNWFHHMIQFFTDLGFSIRWKVVNFAEYGLPQARKRLIIFASCPGEALPPFPKPTHSGDRQQRARYGLARLTTINDAIGNIPPDTSYHDPSTVRRLNVPSYSADMPLPRCITTSGGGNVYPDGTRRFTLREFACLQGFPVDYKFGPTKMLKQVGNAVPPSAGKVFLAEVKKALLKADGLL